MSVSVIIPWKLDNVTIGASSIERGFFFQRGLCHGVKQFRFKLRKGRIQNADVSVCGLGIINPEPQSGAGRDEHKLESRVFRDPCKRSRGFFRHYASPALLFGPFERDDFAPGSDFFTPGFNNILAKSKLAFRDFIKGLPMVGKYRRLSLLKSARVRNQSLTIYKSRFFNKSPAPVQCTGIYWFFHNIPLLFLERLSGSARNASRMVNKTRQTRMDNIRSRIKNVTNAQSLMVLPMGAIA